MIYPASINILRLRMPVHQTSSKNRPRQSIEDWDCLGPSREGGGAWVACPATTHIKFHFNEEI